MKRKKPKKHRENPYQVVTDQIVAALEQGVGPWNRPWSVGSGFLNARTGKPYRGVNALLLMMAMQDYELPLFVTFRQAQALGGSVRQGEKGTRLCFFRFLEREKPGAEGAEPETTVIPLIKFFTVFNVAQTDLPAEQFEHLLPSLRELPVDETVEAFLEGTGATISYGGDRACYIPSRDAIVLPPLPRFEDAGAYYATAFHELTHWTGHGKRLDRDLSGRFGSESYAAEELVAELGAAFLCADFGVEGTLQHPEYIASWIKVLKEDNRAIFTAASKAQQAVDLLRGTELAGRQVDEAAAA